MLGRGLYDSTDEYLFDMRLYGLVCLFPLSKPRLAHRTFNLVSLCQYCLTHLDTNVFAMV